MSYGVGHRHGSDPELLWLWHRPAAITLIRPLAWELPYAMGAGLKRQKRQKKKQNLHKQTKNTGCFNPLHQARDGTHTSTGTQAMAVRFLTHCITVGTHITIFN